MFSVSLSRSSVSSTWPHRYRESMRRVLQMRRNTIWAEGGSKPMDPPRLRDVAREPFDKNQPGKARGCDAHAPLIPPAR